MSKLIRFQPLTALAITGMTVSLLATACSEKNPLSDVQEGLCCKQFSVGADLKNANFGLEGELDGQFKAFAQAGSDLAVVANGALLDVSVACENIARDLGADPAAVDAAVAKGGADAVTDLCTLATAQIKANFSAKGTFKAQAELVFEPPKCTASVDAQASCEGGCSASGECDVSAEPPKCTGGKLTVECSGSCSGEANAAVSCTGACDAKCTGACSAKADVAVDCQGTCEGTCEAGGMTNGTGAQADGSCDGTCNGKCSYAAEFKPPTCEGTCEGSCEGSCTAEAGVKFTCDGSCKGDFEAPKCEGGKLELACDVDVNCKANCEASVSAKAECTPPRVAVTVAGSASLDADAQLQLKAAIASLEANLPNLLLVVEARGAAFLAGVEASAKYGLELTADAGDLSGEAVLCIPAIAGALSEASGNFSASLDASASVVASVGG
ncbi:MAG TPA: hypothetical protein VJN18_07195 [Polyangiaceae bacterium]|nr:hypothetical protein [Polyangiaceae bacterium]